MEFLVKPQSAIDMENSWGEACTCKAPASFGSCTTVLCTIYFSNVAQKEENKSNSGRCVGYCRNVTISPM